MILLPLHSMRIYFKKYLSYMVKLKVFHILMFRHFKNESVYFKINQELNRVFRFSEVPRE